MNKLYRVYERSNLLGVGYVITDAEIKEAVCLFSGTKEACEKFKKSLVN